MIGALTSALTLLYCFVWLRPPEVGGIALPLQRILAWLAFIALVGHLLLKGPLAAGPIARRYLAIAAGFVVFLFVGLAQHAAFGETFFLLYFLMDLSKYAAIFTVAFLCYYALMAGLITEERFVRNVIISGMLAILVVLGLLGLYLLGFRSSNEILAPSRDGALGVWPTGALLPRLSGPTAEPQQLAVAILTPILLMLAPERLRRLWPAAALGLLVMLLSQSKFALISSVFVGIYLFLVYKRQRVWLLASAALALPIAAVQLIRLPTFAATLTQGLEAEAFVERLENLVLLMSIIQQHLVFGIGAGHYGVYRGVTLYGNAFHQPGYSPNMDFLKVFAETGIIGFLLVASMLGWLVVLFHRSYRLLPDEARPRYLAYYLGAVAILLNMTIGYELLHVFFWINVGALLYLVEIARRVIRPGPASGATE